MSNLMEICSVAAELFHVDGQADMIMLTADFHNFVNETEKVKW
jgi:hypothetical protein